MRFILVIRASKERAIDLLEENIPLAAYAYDVQYTGFYRGDTTIYVISDRDLAVPLNQWFTKSLAIPTPPDGLGWWTQTA